jgi:hypothetical protein
MPTTPGNAQHAQHGPTPARRRFRWELVALPIALLLGPWFMGGVDWPVHWSEIVDALHVRRPADYSATACLAATLVGVLACLRVLRSS